MVLRAIATRRTRVRPTRIKDGDSSNGLRFANAYMSCGVSRLGVVRAARAARVLWHEAQPSGGAKITAPRVMVCWWWSHAEDGAESSHGVRNEGARAAETASDERPSALTRRERASERERAARERESARARESGRAGEASERAGEQASEQASEQEGKRPRDSRERARSRLEDWARSDSYSIIRIQVAGNCVATDGCSCNAMQWNRMWCTVL